MGRANQGNTARGRREGRMATATGGNAVTIEEGENENTVTFVLSNEDHTLGASIVYVLNKSPDVVFAGYTIPHPSERKVRLCVQTTEATTPREALKQASESLQNMCSATKTLFLSKVEEFSNTMQE